MHEPSKLLESAEKVCLLFHEVVNNVTGDQLEAAKALLKMTVAINELAIEVNKGKELLAQFDKLKAEIVGQTEAVVKETAENLVQGEDGQSRPKPANLDPNKLVEGILSSFNLPNDLVPKTPKK